MTQNKLQTYLSDTDKLFDKGNYTFRFEYWDKNGKRRFEVSYLNDSVSKEQALKIINRHISEYGEEASLTDFVENDYIKSFLHERQIGLVEVVKGLVPEERNEIIRPIISAAADNHPEITLNEPVVSINYESRGFNSCLEQFIKNLELKDN